MYWIDRNSQPKGITNQVDFYCDTTADITNLPTSQNEGVQQGNDNVSNKPVAKGSTCLCIGSSSLYILNSSDIWTEV